MKKALLFILILSFCLCLFACGDDSDVPSGMFLASYADNMDYKLFAPEGWVVAQATPTTTQVYASNSDRTNVLVNQWNVTESTKTVEDWWKNEYWPQVHDAGAIKNATLEKNGVSATLGGVKAKKYVYTGAVGDADFMYEVYACVTKGSIYVIHVTYMEDGDPNKDEPTFSTVESHKTSIDAIISTFKFN